MDIDVILTTTVVHYVPFACYSSFSVETVDDENNWSKRPIGCARGCSSTERMGTL